MKEHAMTVDVVNKDNQKVGTVAVAAEGFGRRPKLDLVWEAVVHENASARRGTHATKTRGLVAGSGRKLWKQKGTGRARVSDLRNPLWRKGGTVFGPTPRDYGYNLPKKVQRGALVAALAQKVQAGEVTVIDELSVSEPKTKVALALLTRLGATGKTLVVDVQPSDTVALAMRNLVGVSVKPSSRITARDVMDAVRVVVTQAAFERLQTLA
jgi:large subunit ribosomal protein L4